MACVLHTEAYRRRRSILAGLLMPGRDPGGMTILLGIGGALVGGFVGCLLGWYGEDDPVGFIMAVMGAILMLFADRKLSGPPLKLECASHDVITGSPSWCFNSWQRS